MPLIWRLTPPEFADALDGEGSRELGGRWNSPGTAIVYASEHLSLCILEVYVHLSPAQRDALPEFAAVRISVPDDVAAARISLEQLEKLMSEPAPEAACRAAGDRWLAAGKELILTAPSVIVPEESNIMLNPLHPRMRDVAIVSARRFRFDPRLVRH